MRGVGYFLLFISLLSLPLLNHGVLLPRDFPYGQKLTFVISNQDIEFHLTFIAPGQETANGDIVAFEWGLNDGSGVHTSQVSLENLPGRGDGTPEFTTNTYAIFALTGALLTISNYLAVAQQGLTADSEDDTAAASPFMSAEQFFQQATIELNPDQQQKTAFQFITMGKTGTKREAQQRACQSNLPGINIFANPSFRITRNPSFRITRNPSYELEIQITLKAGTETIFYKMKMDITTQLTYLYKLIYRQLWFRDDDPDDDEPPSPYSRRPTSPGSWWSCINCFGNGQQASDSEKDASEPTERSKLLDAAIKLQLGQAWYAGKVY